MISNIGPIGCAPASVIRTPHTKDCNENMNQMVKPYSDKLPRKLQDMQTELSSSLFINLDTYNFFNKIRNSPEKFGKLPWTNLSIEKQKQKVYV